MRTLSLFAAAVVVSVLVARDTEACGGFFRTTIEAETVTLEQSATRMIFEVDELSVTAHVQVGAAGNPSEFAWVIPVPAEPVDLDVSTVDLFEQLDKATAPRLAEVTEEEIDSGGCGCGLGSADGAGGSEDVVRDDGVTIWSRQNVGPYETAVVTSDDPAALRTWLVNGGFEVPAMAEPIIAAYVSSGAYFLAMRLQKDADVSEVQPIRFTYAGTESCVPLRMDSISAPEDQPVLVWVFAEHPAVPDSWAEATINWDPLHFDDGGTNYLDLVKTAVDDAGGQAFVREYASETQYLDSPSEYFEEVPLTDPTLLDLQLRYPWVTRMFTMASPSDMTSDPTFRLEPGAASVSNEHVTYASAAWTPRDSAAACVVAVFGFTLRRRRTCAKPRGRSSACPASSRFLESLRALTLPRSPTSRP